eukprot:CAMPEP_0180616716 /NCGR_PEP_ID=MMETSP1037_2-20121125/32630_1 /TAXON_ID=632150 /ORGANISM="Azadinium spinosum, Strain 3D9" /LENGTH=175 /DNA_ID=CAMNT_0022636577 /DNA_START=181 /DNA_END=708 /DNA_ORIENTATION=+
MAFDRLWHLPDTQYVWHSDGDIIIYRVGEGAGPNFIEASISLLRSDSRVVVTRPTSLIEFQFGGPVIESKFDARWHQGEAPANTYTLKKEPGAPVKFSSEAFLLDVQKFKSLLPLPAEGLLQEQPMETFLEDSFQAKGVFQVEFDCGTNILAGYKYNYSLMFAKSKCNKLSEMLG